MILDLYSAPQQHIARFEMENYERPKLVEYRGRIYMESLPSGNYYPVADPIKLELACRHRIDWQAKN
jgi:hypothetical protein